MSYSFISHLCLLIIGTRIHWFTSMMCKGFSIPFHEQEDNRNSRHGVPWYSLTLPESNHPFSTFIWVLSGKTHIHVNNNNIKWTDLIYGVKRLFVVRVRRKPLRSERVTSRHTEPTSTTKWEGRSRYLRLGIELLVF